MTQRVATLAIRRASLQLGTIAHMPYALAEPEPCLRNPRMQAQRP